MTEPPKRSSNWQAGLRDAGPYLGLGMQLALTMVFFTGVGYLLDRWLGTEPWLLIVGAVTGMIALFVHLVRVTTTVNRERRGKREEGGNP